MAPPTSTTDRSARPASQASFRLKILLAMSGVLVVLTGGSLFGLEWVVRQEIVARLVSDLNASADGLAERFRADQERLGTEARVVAEEPRIKAVLGTPDVDPETLRDVAAETRSSAQWDLLGLATNDGAVRGIAGRSHAPPPQLEQALSGQPVGGYWAEDGSVFQIAAVPVGFERHPIGALVGGTWLDDRALGRIVRTGGVHLALLGPTGLAAATVQGPLRAELARLRSGAIAPALTLGGETFLAKEVTLSPEVSAVVLLSESPLLAPFERLRRAIAGVSGLALLLAIGLAIALSRNLSRPVSELVELARAVQGKDFEAQVIPSGGRELEVLGRTMNEMVAELAAQRRRDELAGFLVHDLKNPLTGVLGNAQFLQSSASPDVKETADDIVGSAQQMLRMVLDLLDISRSADGRLQPKLAEVGVGAFLGTLRDRAAPRAGLRRQTLQVQCDPTLVISADPDLLGRVIDNLLDNCFKYAPAGSAITLEAQRLEMAAELRVRDQGPGIPAEAKERIFDKYFRLARDADQARTSRGLGLVFCKAVVEAHGGRIWVEDAQPHGTVFCIRLPSTAPAPAQPLAAGSIS